jgi:hypothetical protein
VTGVEMLAAASAAGMELWLDGDRVRWRAVEPDPAFLDGLRTRKAEILELLAGRRCRHCGERLAWPEPVGVIHGDGRASCFDCYYQAAAKRAGGSAYATSDKDAILRKGEPQSDAMMIVSMAVGLP